VSGSASTGAATVATYSDLVEPPGPVAPRARQDQSPSPSRRRTLLRATLRILIASVVALLGLGTRATSASASQISVRFKVMSYNTHYSGYPSEISQLEAKINEVGPMVGSSDHSAIALEVAVQ